MLLTIAIFSLTVMGLVQDPKHSSVDEIFGFLGAGCLLAAAIITGSALDVQGLTLFDRVTFLGGGYLAFSLIVGGMTAGIPMLYLANQAIPNPWVWDRSFVIFVAAGASVAAKLLTLEDRQLVTGLAVVFFVGSIYVLACKIRRKAAAFSDLKPATIPI